MVELTLKWEKFGLSQGLHSMMMSHELVDVTIMCQGEFFQAHKSVLAACSQQFKNIFKAAPDKSPIIVLKGVSLHHIKNILHFMYLGEVTVAQDELADFFATADELGISALSKSKDKGLSQRPPPVPPEVSAVPEIQPVAHSSSQLRMNSRQVTPSPVPSPAVSLPPVVNPQPDENIQANEANVDMECEEMVQVIKEEVDDDVEEDDEWVADPLEDTDTNTSMPHHSVMEESYMTDNKEDIITLSDPDDPGPSTSQGGGPWLEENPSAPRRTHRSRPPQSSTTTSSTEQNDPLHSDPSASQGLENNHWFTFEVFSPQPQNNTVSSVASVTNSQKQTNKQIKTKLAQGGRVRCHICRKTYKNLSTLRVHCVKSHGTSAGVNAKTILLSAVNSSRKETTNPEKNLKRKKEWTCKTCSKTFNTLPSLRVHCKKYHGVRVKKTLNAIISAEKRSAAKQKTRTQEAMTCNTCQKTFKSLVSLCAHRLKYHNPSSKARKPLVIRPPKKGIELKREKHEQYQLQCKICLKTFGNRSLLMSHRWRAHYGPKNVLNSKTTAKVVNMKTTSKVVNSKTIAKVVSKREVSTSERERNKHIIKLHSQKGVLTCNQCHKIFKNLVSLQVHFRKTHINTPNSTRAGHKGIICKQELYCFKCDKYFKNLASVQFHNWKYHTGSK